jgi:hypothetical protein
VGVTPRITDDEGGHAVKAQYCDLGTGGLLDDQFSDELVRIEAYATEDWSCGRCGVLSPRFYLLVGEFFTDEVFSTML